MATNLADATDVEATIPCEVCNADIPVASYIQHANAHATLVIPPNYKSQIQSHSNNKTLKFSIQRQSFDIEQEYKIQKRDEMLSNGYIKLHYNGFVPSSIINLVFVYYDPFYFRIFEKGHSVKLLTQEISNKNNNGIKVHLCVTFDDSGNPLSLYTTPRRYELKFKNIIYISRGLKTPVFQHQKQYLEKRFPVQTDNVLEQCCFSVVGKHKIFDIYCLNKSVVTTFVNGLRYFLKQTEKEAEALSNLYLKENKFAVIPSLHNSSGTKRLLLLQQDLFVMTSTTVFRNLEEERIWNIDQNVRDTFNADDLYEEVIAQDVPWRQWSHWIREHIVDYLRQNGLYYASAGNMAATMPMHNTMLPGQGVQHPIISNPNWGNNDNEAEQNTPEQECIVM